MNLTELQMQLRSIEGHISDLQAEIEKMKPQPEDEKKAMFEKITELAFKYPLENRRFPKTSNIDVKAYISCLACISLADDSKIYDKLLFLCRLSHGMGLPMSSEDVFRMGLEIDEKYFDKACSELKSQKYSFLADALILVNITEEATEASFRLIADIAKIFECEKEDLRAAAMVAKAVLIEDFDILKRIPVPSKNRWMGQFKEHIPGSWIRSQRLVCGKICTEILTKPSSFVSTATVFRSSFGSTSGSMPTNSKKTCTIKNRLQAGTVVKKGDTLITYETLSSAEDSSAQAGFVATMAIGTILGRTYSSSPVEKKTSPKQESVYAPCDGVVFFIEGEENNALKNETRKYLFVYVVSYFDDYTEFCEWHKK